MIKKSDKPFFSVVIPSYQQGAFLGDALKSVIEQDVTGEILVLDGGSRDESVSVIKQFESSIDWWRSARDGGQAQAVNEGVKRSRGQVIAWVNSDDLLVTGALQRVEAEFKKYPDTDIVIGSAFWCNEDGSEFSFWSAPRQVRREDFSKGYSYLAQPSVFVSKEFWQKVGGLNESLHLSLDFDLWVRCLNNRASLRIVKEPLSINRIQPGAKTKDYKVFIELQKIADLHFQQSTILRANTYWQAYGIRLFKIFPIQFVLSTMVRKLLKRSKLPGAYVPHQYSKMARVSG